MSGATDSEVWRRFPSLGGKFSADLSHESVDNQTVPRRSVKLGDNVHADHAGSKSQLKASAAALFFYAVLSKNGNDERTVE